MGAFTDGAGVPAAGAELGLSAFNAMDEHGYSLAEYTSELKTALDIKDGQASGGATGASDLQAQHKEMANMLKRERLSASLAKRPSLDLLQQRNIMPDSERISRTSLSRDKLASSLPARPSVELLQQRNILHPADEKAEQLRKKKRLEGFLAERPTPEQVQAQLGSANSAHADSLDATFSGLDESTLPSLDEALGETNAEPMTP